MHFIDCLGCHVSDTILFIVFLFFFYIKFFQLYFLLLVKLIFVFWVLLLGYVSVTSSYLIIYADMQFFVLPCNLIMFHVSSFYSSKAPIGAMCSFHKVLYKWLLYCNYYYYIKIRCIEWTCVLFYSIFK